MDCSKCKVKITGSGVIKKERDISLALCISYSNLSAL